MNKLGLSVLTHIFQIEQEMELILSRPGILRAFSTEWRVKWVPAIVGYCRRLKKRRDC